MLLATLREPPARGSVREFVLSLLVMKKQQVEHARLRALAQISIDKDKGVQAFEQYMKLAFPWIETAKQRENEEIRKILLREVKGGALSVTPVFDTTFTSKQRMKVVKAEEARRQEWLPKASRVLNKIGSIVPKESNG